MLHQKLRKVNKDDCKTPVEKFLKSVPKPARIPPQTPPAGGKSVEAGRILSPRRIVSPCRPRFGFKMQFRFLAEEVRFELTVGCPTPVFKTGALDHSATPPYF